jgi:hypothetical protein
LDRKEAVDLVKELGDRELIQPSFVVIEHSTPEKCQLKIKGDCDFKQIEVFLNSRGFSYEEKTDYLIIFKP